MDEFERAYFIQLKKMAADYQSQRRALAQSRIKMFVAAVYRQLIDEKEKFDIILAAGNSGLYMMEIAKIVYQELKIELPQTINLPIFRFIESNGQKIVNDNQELSKYVSEKLNTITKNPNVLFIDDEIMTGRTVKTSLTLLLRAFPEITKLRCVVIAEHHFFEWHFNLPKVSINFFAYARLIQGLNGNIAYFIPDDLYSQISLHIPDVQSYNHAMAIVIGGALKRKAKSEVPFYDTTATDMLKKIYPHNYEQAKNTLYIELKELVAEGIEDYKHETVKFRF